MLRAANYDDPAICHLSAPVWWPAITKSPVLRYDLFDGDFGGAIVAPSSSMTLAISAWPDFARYALADAKFELWTGEVGAPLVAWTKRFNGIVTEQPEVANGAATVAFAVDDRWLDKPLLALYEGTTGAEGEAALKGAPKPLALGAPRYVPGILADSVDTMLQLSAYGPVVGIDVALERLSRFGAPYANYATFDALKAAAIPAGRWATCNAEGWVKHGAPLEGQPSYLLRGDVAASTGWARTPGAIIKRIAEIAGAVDRVSNASLAGLDQAAPWPISLWLADQVTVRDIIQRIAASVNAVAGISWLGELFVSPVAIGEPSIELRSDGTALPPVGDVSQLPIAQPFWRLALQAERAWRVHALGDIAFTAPLIEVGAYQPGETYREGNIVSLPDGSRWLYVFATPSTGNTPAIGSTYWAMLSGPVEARYADGTPIDDLKPAQPGADVTGDNTSKDTENVGGRPSTEVIIDQDRGLINQLIASARAEVDRQRLRARLFPGGDGAAVETLIRRESDARSALAQLVTTVSAASGVTEATVFQVLEAMTDGEEGFARFLMRAEVIGGVARFASLEGYVGGGLSALDFTADRIRFIDPDTSVPYIYFDVDANGIGTMRASKVVVDTLEVNTAVVPLRAIATAELFGGGASGAWQTALSGSITLTKAGWIEAGFVAKQHFSDGDDGWEFDMLIGDTSVYNVTGTKTQDSVPVSGARLMPAGTHTVLTRWRADGSIRLRNRNLFAKAYPDTQ
ncbi:MAG TPA: hypothetical protein DEP91_04400 [Sphingomonas bacterium]|uniref:Uncharacterized protein n=1 Tax=Sphingomonas bacterium TaxID=1895847 RepID=A0A3D0WCB7_9SPHN|nr:hypothetical protein [Sphingomonas bacterium]